MTLVAFERRNADLNYDLTERPDRSVWVERSFRRSRQMLWGRGWRGAVRRRLSLRASAESIVIPSERSESRNPHRADLQVPRRRVAYATRDDAGARSRSGLFRWIALQDPRSAVWSGRSERPGSRRPDPELPCYGIRRS